MKATQRTCTVPDCTRNMPAKGRMCDTHATRLRRWGTTDDRPALTVHERIKARVEVLSEVGCWHWTGAVNSAGYGQIRTNGHVDYTHRVMYKHSKGTIPEGLHVDHLCRNRRCCNPEHLEAVTPAENMRRGEAPAAVATRTNRCGEGHDLADAYVRPDGAGRQCRECRNRRASAKGRT